MSELLSKYENSLVTDMGAWFPGERVVFRGKDLFTEMNDFGWFELLCFGILGRELELSKIKMFETLFVISSSFPDPRLWNNRISALAGSSRSTASLAVSASSAVTEAAIYGYRPIIKSAYMLKRFVDSSKNGGEIRKDIENEMKKNRILYGYGRPVTTADERIIPLLKAAKKLGHGDGEYVKMAFSIEGQLVDMGYKWRMNIAALVSGVMLDLGLTPDECVKIYIYGFAGGFMPCFMDAEKNPEGSFFPFRCERIHYVGEGRRKWA